MRTVQAKMTGEYIKEYIVYESTCPNCGSTEEHHLNKEAMFFIKQMRCYKCKAEFIVENEIVYENK